MKKTAQILGVAVVVVIAGINLAVAQDKAPDVWTFRMGSDGRKGILGKIEFIAGGQTGDRYNLRIQRGELWTATSSGNLKHSQNVLTFAPTAWNTDAIPYEDLITLSDNNIPLKSQASYRVFNHGGSINLCHTERQRPSYNITECDLPWTLSK